MSLETVETIVPVLLIALIVIATATYLRWLIGSGDERRASEKGRDRRSSGSERSRHRSSTSATDPSSVAPAVGAECSSGSSGGGAC